MSSLHMQSATQQWASRPADQRFTSLYTMGALYDHERATSKAVVVANRDFSVMPATISHDGKPVMASDHKSLAIVSKAGHAYAPTHWAFGQIASLAGAPAGYLRTLPAEMAADNLNYGLHHARDPESVGLLLQRNGGSICRAATGPDYGRIWNADIINTLIDRYGDGATGEWRVPGEFGERVPVTPENTTLYGSDRDIFIFLANEEHRIEIPNRRDGKSGSLARGFYVKNSEVGSGKAGIGTFLFDFACRNRTIWGGEGFQSVEIRHTKSAPHRWLEELQPALVAFANASTEGVRDLVKAAQARRVEDVDAFLASRFGKSKIAPMKAVHEAEEHRPIESLWDVSVAATAYAKSVEYVDTRIDFEREAGKVLMLAR